MTANEFDANRFDSKRFDHYVGQKKAADNQRLFINYITIVGAQEGTFRPF